MELNKIKDLFLKNMSKLFELDKNKTYYIFDYLFKDN